MGEVHEQNNEAAVALDASTGSSSSTGNHVESCILFQNQTRTVFLIDIPASISLAQGHARGPDMPWLLSNSPMRQPHLSTEPKSDAARAHVEERTQVLAEDVIYRDLICQGLSDLRRAYDGSWCVPRQVSDFPLLSTKGKRNEPFPAPCPTFRTFRASSHPYDLSNHSRRSRISPIDMGGRPFRNTNSTPVSIHIEASWKMKSSVPSSLPSKSARPLYYVPPSCVFVLYNLNPQSVAPIQLQKFFSPALLPPTSTAGPSQFDLIILDPPWPNRSARRSNTYATAGRGSDDPLCGLAYSLGAHISPAGAVACWITHRPAARAAALEAFWSWGLQLEEEWVWLKVTANGEPVWPVDGLWRKPWEVLLIGRRPHDNGSESGSESRKEEDDDDGDDEPLSKKTVEARQKQPKRRLLMAVPDLHSRKPCMKDLVPDLLGAPAKLQLQPQVKVEVEQKEQPRVLEVFARHLTAGWWAWGDEVLRYNWEGHWSSGPGRSEGEEEDLDGDVL